MDDRSSLCSLEKRIVFLSVIFLYLTSLSMLTMAYVVTAMSPSLEGEKFLASAFISLHPCNRS